jgi:hypothetical protein
VARLGRGRPASSLLRGAGISARAGTLSASAGGSGTLSVSPVQNLITNASFEVDASGWSSSGFSLVSGSSVSSNTDGTLAGPYLGSRIGVVATTSTDQGANYAPTTLGNFLPGVRYYAQIAVKAAFAGDLVEIVLGSTSDDYAAVQFNVTNSWQVITLSWVPQVIRTATDHGLALRTKEVGGTANNTFHLDAAIIATSDGFWEGWRVGGKNGRAALAVSAGGNASLGTGQAASGALTASAGGGGTFSARKGGLVSLAPSAGGSAALTVTGAHAGALTASAGGSGTLLELTAALLLPAGFFGGGGRVGRSHPALGVTTRGVGATIAVFSRSGALTGSGGGGSSLSGSKGGRLLTTTTAGGNSSLAVLKGGAWSLAASAGGSGSLSGIQTPTTGGITATFLMGGGGRVGRSHPVHLATASGGARLSASNPDVRTGALVTSAGGSGTLAGRKGGISTTPVAIAAPPPVFVTVLLLSGLRASADGSFAYAYTRTAVQVGSLTGSAGGTGTFRAAKASAGALTGPGGPQAALTVRKGGRGSLTGSAGGSFTYSYTRFEARNGSLASSAGGTGTLRASKQAAVVVTGSAGGQLTPRTAKGGRGALATSAGGGLTYTYVRGGLAAIGTLTGSAGGSGTLTTRKGIVSLTILSSAGGSATATHIKGATLALSASGGGNGTFTRAAADAPIIIGLVNPLRRRTGRVSGRDKGHSPLVRR